MNSADWPTNYPTPEAIVDASLSATNYADEFAAFKSLRISDEDGVFFSHLVASASHSVWLFPDISRIIPDDSHPAYRVALQHAQRGFEKFLSQPDPSSEDKEFISELHDRMSKVKAASPMDFWDHLILFGIKACVIVAPILCIVAFIYRLRYGRIILENE